MDKSISDIKIEFEEELKTISNTSDIEKLKIKYLSRKGIINQLIKTIKSVSSEKRPLLGKVINDLKIQIENDLKNYNYKENPIISENKVKPELSYKALEKMITSTLNDFDKCEKIENHMDEGYLRILHYIGLLGIYCAEIKQAQETILLVDKKIDDIWAKLNTFVKENHVDIYIPKSK